ncbi:hypothetical protein PYR71_01335 [Rhizobium sp. MC63]|uniref:Uncharacterized protein n=1 Tax=Rhizobium mulingense TaxID=3031128 RepID=A0ACC6MVN7_9HYPH|nr:MULTISPECIES: hypothetical protein [unclassified Rhizobium]MDF0695171.1 hypothetical protein [Rhizobium sp. MC63]MEA3517465.1 hypothetical protein [Rhizobium sp. MJ31]MEB3045636.1 hypothetical protein [Rhizobium sp. MJ21]
MFEGRAAALLDIDDRHDLVDRSLSEFTGGGRASKSVAEMKPAEVEPATPLSLMLAEESIPASTATDIAEEAEIAYLDLSPRPAAARKASPKPQEAEQRVVAVSEFEQECEKLIANMRDEWTAETGRDAMALVRRRWVRSGAELSGIFWPEKTSHSLSICQLRS